MSGINRRPAASGRKRHRRAGGEISPRLAVFGFCLLAAAAATAATRLSVTTTVPHRTCVYPSPCSHALPHEDTWAHVSVEEIRYAGTPPAVTRQGDLLIVEF